MHGEVSSVVSLFLAVLRGAVCGLLLGAGLHFGWILAGPNFHAAVPGLVYRCAQPSARALERAIRQHGIRTVLNLRGCCINAPWYRDEARITGELGVSQEDIFLSASRLPSTVSLRQLVEALERSDYPVLIHCHQGADRTGLAVVAYYLLRTNQSLDDALAHLGPAYGHVPAGRTRHMDRFFRLYREWLTQQRREHAPALFRDWALHHYCPGPGRAELTVLEASAGVLRLPAGQRQIVTLRCHNTSIRPWRFRPDAHAGIHAWYSIFDRQERSVRLDRVGLFHACIEPGGHIDLKLPLGPLPAGRYQLRIDLADEQHAWFVQLGNDMLCIDLEVS